MRFQKNCLFRFLQRYLSYLIVFQIHDQASAEVQVSMEAEV